MTDRQSLRQTLKQARRNLSVEDRWHYAIAATQGIIRHPLYKRAQRIGLYTAVGAERPTLPLAVEAESSRKQLYYPAVGLRHKQQMHFVHCHALTEWRAGSFNIPEPVPTTATDILPARMLDIVFLPLVGFDNQGNRLGMGAGYYDRCFAFRRHRRTWKRPLLIGLAYDCQQADRIPAEPWDVPLDGIATESGLQIFTQR